MSNKPINLRAISDQAGVHNLLEMTTARQAMQRRLDLFATMSMLTSGFVSHPQYNVLMTLDDDIERFVEEVKDEFREINGYIVEQFDKFKLLKEDRYCESDARKTLIEIGFVCADYFHKHGHFMSYKFLLNAVDDLLKKNFKLN